MFRIVFPGFSWGSCQLFWKTWPKFSCHLSYNFEDISPQMEKAMIKPGNVICVKYKSQAEVCSAQAMHPIMLLGLASFQGLELKLYSAVMWSLNVKYNNLAADNRHSNPLDLCCFRQNKNFSRYPSSQLQVSKRGLN